MASAAVHSKVKVSVVVDVLFLIAPDVCGFLCLVPVFVMQYLMSFLVFFTTLKRELVALL